MKVTTVVSCLNQQQFLNGDVLQIFHPTCKTLNASKRHKYRLSEIHT